MSQWSTLCRRAKTVESRLQVDNSFQLYNNVSLHVLFKILCYLHLVPYCCAYVDSDRSILISQSEDQR